MDTASLTFTFCFLLTILISCFSGSSHILVKDFEHKELRTSPRDDHILHPSRKELVQGIRHDFAGPSVNPYPTTPITNPVTTPITNPVTTPITNPITAPSVDPIPITSPVNPATPVTNPVTTPITNPITAPSVDPIPITNPVNPATPVTNPVTTPSTTYNPGAQVPVNSTNPVTTPSTTYNPGAQVPVNSTNPGTTYPNPTVPVTTPVVAQPVTTTNAPAIPGQSWCVARSGVVEADIQEALDYACGMGGADCSAIQQGGSCYSPNTMQNHASYAFNSYYQRNPVQSSCDFRGAAFITNMNPSSGPCIYPTWSSSSALPNSASPITTNPTSTPTANPTSTPTTTSSGATPVSFPTGTPTLGGGAATGYGVMPAMANTSSTSLSIGLQPLILRVAMVTSVVTWKLILNV